ALLLYRFGRIYPSPFSPHALAAAWFLNPLVIWASTVHGEVDTLAALLVLVALLTALERRWFYSGAALGFAIFAKGYPIALLPIFAAILLAELSGPSATRWRLSRSVSRWVGGLALSVVPFLYLLAPTEITLLTKAGSPIYGGISVLGIYNAASPKGAGLYAGFASSPGAALASLTLLRGFGISLVLLSTVLLYWRLTRVSVRTNEPVTLVGVACLVASLGVFLSDSAPQPENVVGLLSLVLVAASAWNRRAVLVTFVLLSGAGLAMYWSFLTPFGMFYPLAVQLGPGAVQWVNNIAIRYIEVAGLRGSIWLTAGLVGGTLAIILGASGVVRLTGGGVISRLRGRWRGDEAPAMG
ncbi:MAG TPA: hypothetical protein VFG07_03035, partial [Thermoplasmata archaeon]|nr:hypothetical protein [Thermoplasmata archaeon]